MKAIMTSIKPKYVALELNGIKNIEVRKVAPKDWKDYLSGKTTKKPKPRTCYIYCTKDKEQLTRGYSSDTKGTKYFIYNDNEAIDYRGKVVAKFTLNKVEELYIRWGWGWETKSIDDIKVLESRTCLTRYDFAKYLKGKKGYAWHIDNLVIFDEPKELNEFKTFKEIRVCKGCSKNDDFFLQCEKCEKQHLPLTKAPQSWCYVEVLL